MREYRKRRKSVIPKLVADETTTVIPKSESVIPVQPNFQPLPNCPDGRYRDADGNVATYVKPKSLIVKPNTVQPKVTGVLEGVQPKSTIPKLPWYAGASNHFFTLTNRNEGEVRNKHYAKEFFNSLGV